MLQATCKSARALAAVVPLCLLAMGCSDFAAQGRNAEGVRLFSQGRYLDSLREFQEATYADPKNADGYYNLAATYHRMGKQSGRASDLEQAERYYNLCLDHRESHSECYRGLAVLLAETGRNEEAFRLVQGWCDRQPGSAEAKIELARLYDERGEMNAARQRLLEALTVEPDNARALAALGHVRERSGEAAQALAAYQRSFARDNRQPELGTRIAGLQSSLYGSGAWATGDTGPSWGYRGGTPPNVLR